VVAESGQKLTEQQIIEDCHQHLAKFKVPQCVEFLPDLPKSDSGKILKRVLKERLS